jgi:iron complex outermembrane recepter protein
MMGFKSSGSYNAFSPKVGATYHMTENRQLYLTYSRGFRTGGITQRATNDGMVLYKFDPEFSNNFELGFKNSFLNNKVNFNAATFYIVVDNIQVPTLLKEGYTETRNAGKLTSKGIEFELNTTPVKGLQIDYNVGLTDASYDDLKVSTSSDSGDVEVDNDGNRQIFTPNLTAMLAVQYNYVDVDDVRVFVRVEWMTIGKQYFDLANQINQPAYHLLNARIGLAYSGFEAALWGRNIAGKNYIAYAYDFGAAHLGNPANFGVTVKKSFSF